MEIKSRGRNLDEPWIIFGDFNEIRRISEREGTETYDEDGAREFNDKIETTELN